MVRVSGSGVLRRTHGHGEDRSLERCRPKSWSSPLSVVLGALGVRALLISVFCCFGPFCGLGRPQDLVERVGFEISCRNQGSLPSGIGSKAIFGVGDRSGQNPAGRPISGPETILRNIE